MLRKPVFAPCRRWRVCPNEQHPINRWETFPFFLLFFFFNPQQKSADRELSSRAEASALCPLVNTVLHVHPILAGIFIVLHVFICVCLCVWDEESECVDLRALQGCEARRSKRPKNPPVAFGLVSASSKPSTMLHVRYPQVSPLQENCGHFPFRSRSGTQTSTLIQQHCQRSLQLTCCCVSRAIRLICGNFPPDVASCCSHATQIN